MNVILAVDSIRFPLTGIGKYTRELALRLPAQADITSLNYMAHGRWRSIDQLTPPPTAHEAKRKLINFRKLGQIPAFNFFYCHLVSLLPQLNLIGKKADLYHGPNYFLPHLDIPGVLTVHDLSTFVNSRWHPKTRITRINKQLPLSINRAKLIITDTQVIKEEVVNYFGIAADRIAVVPLGVDDIFKPREQNSTHSILEQYHLHHKGYSLCVATIEPRKNILPLITAYKRLPLATRKRWPLVLIGEAGWNSEPIHQAIKTAEREGWLHYFGYIHHEDLPFIYTGARLFIYPSAYEGFGLPVLEAMASGVPVLTSCLSCLPEVAGGAAMLVDPQDDQAFRDSLRQCLEDEIWQGQAIQAGLKRAEALNWETCAQKTVQAYRLAM